MVRLPRNEKHTYWLNGRLIMRPSIELTNSNATIGFDFGHDLDLEFLRSNMEFAMSQPKIVRLPRNESKSIDWILGLKCDHQIWPRLWPWHWIFKIKYGICFISTKSGPIVTNRKAKISIELQASNVTNGFDFGRDLDLWIFKVKCDFDLWPHTWPRISVVKFWNSRISEWES